jgi:L-amino acid N-acyltransferase
VDPQWFTICDMQSNANPSSIGNAARGDLPEVLAIYNEVIRNSTAVYTEEEFAPARGEAWFAGKGEQGFPVLVARDASGITGFGTFG